MLHVAIPRGTLYDMWCMLRALLHATWQVRHYFERELSVQRDAQIVPDVSIALAPGIAPAGALKMGARPQRETGRSGDSSLRVLS
jgi:hypothetical protein